MEKQADYTVESKKHIYSGYPVAGAIDNDRMSIRDLRNINIDAKPADLFFVISIIKSSQIYNIFSVI